MSDGTYCSSKVRRASQGILRLTAQNDMVCHPEEHSDEGSCYPDRPLRLTAQNDNLIREIYQLLCRRTGHGYAVRVDHRTLALEFRIEFLLDGAVHNDPVTVLQGL